MASVEVTAALDDGAPSAGAVVRWGNEPRPPRVTPRPGERVTPAGRTRARPAHPPGTGRPGGRRDAALASPPVTSDDPGRIFLLRHGETEWSATGRHTGHTDVPLTDAGRAAARRVRVTLTALRGGSAPARVLCSPRTRARDTAALAGLVVDAVDDRLVEWDYGDLEGLSTPQIRERLPGWTVWDGPWPGGETPGEVGARADAVLDDARASLADGDVVLVGHGHFSRVLTARWVGLPATGGVHVRLDPAGITVLGAERGVPRLDHVNHTPPAEHP